MLLTDGTIPNRQDLAPNPTLALPTVCFNVRSAAVAVTVLELDDTMGAPANTRKPDSTARSTAQMQVPALAYRARRPDECIRCRWPIAKAAPNPVRTPIVGQRKLVIRMCARTAGRSPLPTA